MSVNFQVNGKPAQAHAETDTPLLWVLRDELGMTGTKFGCGAALCGACTVHVNGEAVRSCQTPVSAIAGKSITTLEGLPAWDAARRRLAGHVLVRLDGDGRTRRARCARDLRVAERHLPRNVVPARGRRRACGRSRWPRK